MASLLNGVPLDRADIPDALELNLRVAYISTQNGITPIYPEIYNVEDADTLTTREAVFFGLGLYDTLAENDDPTYDAGGEAWAAAFVIQTFALGTEVSWQAVDDDIHGVIKALTATGGNIAETATYTQEVNSLNIFNSYATSSSGAPTGLFPTIGGTVYPLLSKTHALADGTTWANRTDADVDLSEETMEMFYGFWGLNQKNQRGQLTRQPMKTIMVGSKEKMLADRIFKTTDRRPQSADNDINPLTQLGMRVIEQPLMSSDGRFFLFGAKESTGLRYYVKMNHTVRRWPDGSNGNFRYVGLYRVINGMAHYENTSGSI